MRNGFSSVRGDQFGSEQNDLPNFRKFVTQPGVLGGWMASLHEAVGCAIGEFSVDLQGLLSCWHLDLATGVLPKRSANPS